VNNKPNTTDIFKLSRFAAVTDWYNMVEYVIERQYCLHVQRVSRSDFLSGGRPDHHPIHTPRHRYVWGAQSDNGVVAAKHVKQSMLWAT